MAKWILVVDDERDITTSLKTFLENNGYIVSTACDGPDCLQKLEKEKPDLILMDFFMPTMSGRETVERIRANPKTKDIPIIFLTVAQFGERGMEIIKELKVADYIQKPVNTDELLGRIKRVSP